MASGIYNIFKSGAWEGDINLSNESGADVIKVALMNNSHSFDATHNNWSDVSANEISGTGYIAGGEIISGQDVTKAGTTKFDADDVVWSGASFTAYHAVMYNATTLELIASFDFNGAQVVAGADFTIQWNVNGILTSIEI